MKKLSLLLLISAFVFCGCDNDDNDSKTYVLSLPNYETHTHDLGNIDAPVSSWITSYDYEGVTYNTHYFQTLLTDNSKLFEFDCFSSEEFGLGSNSFGFINCTVDNCTDFKGYDYRALPKKGVSNNTYVIVGADGFTAGEHANIEPSIQFKENENKNKVEDYHVKGLYITNCYFAYNSMKEGSAMFGGLDKFENGDTFKVIIYNMDKSRNVECILAEGTNFVTTWKWVDLTSLGETTGLKFKVKTKENQYGAMNPTYFCLDGITLED